MYEQNLFSLSGNKKFRGSYTIASSCWVYSKKLVINKLQVTEEKLE